MRWAKEATVSSARRTNRLSVVSELRTQHRLGASRGVPAGQLTEAHPGAGVVQFVEGFPERGEHVGVPVHRVPSAGDTGHHIEPAESSTGGRPEGSRVCSGIILLCPVSR
jgi:hypothetical protein